MLNRRGFLGSTAILGLSFTGTRAVLGKKEKKKIEKPPALPAEQRVLHEGHHSTMEPTS